MGWWTIAPLVVAGIFFHVADGAAERLSRPDLLFGAWAARSDRAVALGRPVSMAWFAIPIVDPECAVSPSGE